MYSTIFGSLRRSLRSIAVRLSEADEEPMLEIAHKLRVYLCEWLTAPIRFDETMLDAVSVLGDAATVETKWGHDVRLAYDIAREAAVAIQNTTNPIRERLYEIIRHLKTEESSWRIYCHRRARAHFESIFQGELLPADCFLHSVRDYRETVPFDVLIKVGPLRSRGWGSAPDALLSSPRFRLLIQIVWSGCADEEDFGYDPIAQPAPGTTPDYSHRGVGGPTSWTRQVTRIGSDESEQRDVFNEIDELKFFYEASRPGALRRAILVEIDEDHGILYPPHSQVASFDPMANAESPLDRRQPGETLSEGMLLLRPILADPDLGGLHAKGGYYSRIWKERLSSELKRNATDLVRRLREAGIDLQWVHGSVRHWCRPPSTVIHAPQLRKHFEILIKVLGIDHEIQTPAHMRHLEWWQYAWAEIARSRGEAIQAGLQEHEILNEELFAVLGELLPEIRRKAEAQHAFEIEIPRGRSLQGTVLFYFVQSIEESFLAPDNVLGTVCDLETIEQWRA